VDLDGVLCDTMYTTLKYINKKYGFNYTINDITKYRFEDWIPNWTTEDSRKLFLRKNLYKYAPLIKNAVNAIYLLQSNDFDVEYLTVRDLRLTDTTYEWFDKNGISSRDLWFFTSGDQKIKYIRENYFDIIVEDNLDYLRELNTSDGVFFLYLIDYPYNQNSPKGITRVGGWNEIIKDLKLWGFIR
jgi:uncharacterized HAD superfamily protein